VKRYLQAIGVTRGILVVFLLVLWAAGMAVGLELSPVLADCLVRTGMNGVLVLALVPAVRAGVGLNFGLPLGIVCGLIATVLPMNVGLRGWDCFAAALALATLFGAIAGIGYAKLLERVPGEEMMVGVYVGFASVAAAAILWLIVPVQNPELLLPLGGKGFRQTLVLDGYFGRILDRVGQFKFGSGVFPTGLLVFWLSLCGLIAFFFRTRIGIALTAAGENARFARASGIDVGRMRTVGVTLSTALAAVGIVVFSQSYGFVQLYKAPLLMAFPTVAALLIGGASVRHATIAHVIVGTFLFQSVLTTALPLVNRIVTLSPNASELSNIPEIARLIISNGIILYALTRKDST